MREAQVISVKIVPQIESVKRRNVRGNNSVMAREIYRSVRRGEDGITIRLCVMFTRCSVLILPINTGIIPRCCQHFNLTNVPLER